MEEYPPPHEIEAQRRRLNALYRHAAILVWSAALAILILLVVRWLR